jgi:hypothetical protein
MGPKEGQSGQPTAAGVRAHGHRQVEWAKTQMVDDLWLANSLATTREVARQASVSRSTAWERKRLLMDSGRLPLMNRKQLGHARFNARFAEVLSDPNSIYYTRPRRKRKVWAELQVQFRDPVTGRVWRSPIFPNLYPRDGVPDEEFLGRFEELLGPACDDFIHRVLPAWRSEHRKGPSRPRGPSTGSPSPKASPR